MAVVPPGDRFVEMVGTFFGLARDGKSDRKGVPRPLQLAVSATAYRERDPDPWPAWRSSASSSACSRRWAGYAGRRPYYPEYVTSDIVVEPDPAALALLTPGRAPGLSSPAGTGSAGGSGAGAALPSIASRR